MSPASPTKAMVCCVAASSRGVSRPAGAVMVRSKASSLDDISGPQKGYHALVLHAQLARQAFRQLVVDRAQLGVAGHTGMQLAARDHAVAAGGAAARDQPADHTARVRVLLVGPERQEHVAGV